jgi:hypothetical protein
MSAPRTAAKRGSGSIAAVGEAAAAVATAPPVILTWTQAAAPAEDGAEAAEPITSALSDEEAKGDTAFAPSQRVMAAQAARESSRRGKAAAASAADAQAEQVRRLIAEQRHLQQELAETQHRAALAAATATAEAATAAAKAATAAAEAAKEQKGKKVKKHSKRRRSKSSSQSSSDSNTSQSSGSSDDSDSEHDADDNEQFKQYRNSGRSKDIKRHVRRRFSKAFSHDWKGAGLEAEARRLLTLKEAVRGLGKAGMTGKATAVAAAKLISDVQSGLKAYDASAQDAPDKVAALEKAVVRAVEKRANKKLADALKEEELLLVPSVGKRAGARAYGDKGRKGRGAAETQEAAAAFTAGLAQGQQQQQQQQQQSQMQPTLPAHSGSMAMQQPYMFQQHMPLSQQYNPGMAGQQQMAAAQQYGGYGAGGGRYGQGRASDVCYNCNKPGHIGRNCPARGLGAAAAGSAHAAGTDGAATVRDTPHTSHPRIGDGSSIQLPQIGQAVHMLQVPQIGHDMYSHPQIGQGYPQIGTTHAQIADSRLRVCPAHVHVSRQEPSSAMSHSSHGCDPDRASMCAAGRHVVDTLPKEAKVLDGPAQRAQARRMEQEHAQLHAELLREITCMQSSEFNTADPDEYVLKWDMDDTTGASATERRREQAEPPAAGMPLRVAIKLTGVPSRGERGVCLFCRRKGHRRGTCMAAPAVVQMPQDDNRTPLQREKERWVLALLARPTRRLEEMAPRHGETRLQATQRQLQMGAEANAANPWAHSTKRRDKLRRALGYWWAIGADATVLSWIGFGVKLLFEREPERVCFPNHRSYHEHVDHVDAEHAKHVAEGSFVEVDGAQVHIGNPLQVEVNAKGKRRMCSDDRYPNAFVADYDFTQEGLKEVAALVQMGWMMITTDVEQAYYQVPLHKSSQKYLAWVHRGKWYIPTIIVFGTKPAPFVFTKIMRPVLRFVRALGISGTNCIDDNLWAGPPAAMPEITAVVQLLFGTLGWVFNSKCVFKASTSAVYNGMWIDSAKYEMRAPDEKWERARKLAWSIWYQARDGQQVLLKDLQRLTGVLHSIKLAVEGVSVWTRGVYADQTECVRNWQQAGQSYAPKHARTHLSVVAMEDVWFWATRLSDPARYNGQPIDGPGVTAEVIVHSDAGDLGYGMHARVEAGQSEPTWTAHGVLADSMLGESSTAREISGLMAAAAQQVQRLRGKRVRFVMDSYPAMRNLTRGGGPVAQLNELVRQWWRWCKQHGVQPSFEWVPRERNTLADELSKVVAATLELRPGVEARVRQWLQKCGVPGVRVATWERTQVYTPRWDCICYRVQELLRRREPACIIVPSWGGAAWTALLRNNSTHRTTLGQAGELLVTAPTGLTGVTLQAYVIAPRC